MPASSVEKSKGSSTSLEDFSAASSSRSRSARPFFLRSWDVFEKVLTWGLNECRGCGRVTGLAVLTL